MRTTLSGHSRVNRDFPYNGKIAQWWLERADDSAHRYAYRKIADFIEASISRPPSLIIDYACGAGNLLSVLSRRFLCSNLVGLDGSSFLLDLAEGRFSHLPRGCSTRISLIRTALPRFNLMRGKADLVTYCFPNMMIFPQSYNLYRAFPLNEGDRKIARILSLADKSGFGNKDRGHPRSIQRKLEESRCIALNLRRLLVRGGICVRVEYATTKRHEWSNLVLQKVCFEEGTLDTDINGVKSRPWFRVLASAYFRSRILEDVYQQTGDKRDRNGGYLLTVLRAV